MLVMEKIKQLLWTPMAYIYNPIKSSFLSTFFKPLYLFTEQNEEKRKLEEPIKN